MSQERFVPFRPRRSRIRSINSVWAGTSIAIAWPFSENEMGSTCVISRAPGCGDRLVRVSQKQDTCKVPLIFGAAMPILVDFQLAQRRREHRLDRRADFSDGYALEDIFDGLQRLRSRTERSDPHAGASDRPSAGAQ